MFTPFSARNCDSPEVLGALANQARLDIMFSLLDGEKCVSQLMAELGLSQTLVSHSMKKLEMVGFVSARRDGKFRFFRLNREFAEPFLSAIDPSRNPAMRGNLFRTILAHAPITITVTDRNGVFIFVFGDILKKYGAVEEDFIGKSYLEFYGKRPDIIEHMHQALKGEKAHWVTRRPDHTFDTVSTPYRDERGEIAGAVNVSYEIAPPPRSKWMSLR